MHKSKNLIVISLLSIYLFSSCEFFNFVLDDLEEEKKNSSVKTTQISIDEKDNGSMIYFAKVSMENFDETATYVDSIEKEFKTFKLPEIYRISYITYTDKSDLNPYFVGDYYTFLINNEGEILVIDEE